jgi:hypothetical protein
VEQVGETSFQVTGDLTMRGVTKPITMVLELADVENDPSGSFQVVFQSTATINRQDWGVKWNTALEGGGALIGDKVLLKFDVAAIRCADEDELSGDRASYLLPASVRTPGGGCPGRENRIS